MNHYFVHFSFLEQVNFLMEREERLVIKAESEQEARTNLEEALKEKKYFQLIKMEKIPEPNVDYVSGEVSIDLPKKDTLQ